MEGSLAVDRRNSTLDVSFLSSSVILTHQSEHECDGAGAGWALASAWEADPKWVRARFLALGRKIGRLRSLHETLSAGSIPRFALVYFIPRRLSPSNTDQNEVMAAAMRARTTRIHHAMA